MNCGPDTAALRQTAPVQPTLIGKPLRWTRGWSMVVVVWLLVGGLLLTTRLQMGHLTAWTPREAAAVADVRAYRPDGTHRCDELIGVVAYELARQKGRRESSRWFAFDRPWERRVYVVWEWGDQATLSFVVEHGVVAPDEHTRLVLDAVAESWPVR